MISRLETFSGSTIKDPRLLDRLNGEQDRKGALRFEPARRAVRRIRQTGSPSPNRLRSWIEHPDRVVPLALAWRHLRDPAWSSRWDAVHAPKLLARALEDAEGNRMLWTPLLDAAARIAAPPSTTLTGRVMEPLDDLDLAVRDAVLRRVVECFRYPPLVRASLQNLERLPRSILQRALETPGGPAAVLRNPHLREGPKRMVVDWVIDTADRAVLLPAPQEWLQVVEVLRAIDSASGDEECAHLLKKRMFTRWPKSEGPTGRAVPLVVHLRLPSWRHRLRELVAGRGRKRDRPLACWLNDRGRLTGYLLALRFFRAPGTKVAGILPEVEVLNAREIEAVLWQPDVCRDPDAFASAFAEILAECPAVREPLIDALRAVILKPRDDRLKRRVAAAALMTLLNSARKEEDLLGIAPATRSIEDLKRLMAHEAGGPRSTGEGVEELLRWEEDPRQALEALAAVKVDRLKSVDPRALKKYLQHQNRWVRGTAMRLVGRCGGVGRNQKVRHDPKSAVVPNGCRS